MYRIKTMNKIAPAGLDQCWTRAASRWGSDVENEDGILVRSRQDARLCLPGCPAGHRPGGRRHQQHSHRPLLRGRHRGLQYPRCQRQRSKGAGRSCALLHGLPGHRRGRGLGAGAGSTSECGCGRRPWRRARAAFVGPELYRQDPGCHRPGCHRRPGGQHRPSTWGWTCTATTPSCLWTPPCAWTAMSTVVKDVNDLYKSCLTMSPSTCPYTSSHQGHASTRTPSPR